MVDYKRIFKELMLKHGDEPDEKFDPEQLAMGIDIEKEHTDDEDIAKQIAKAHLMEISDYYTRLKAMESEAEDNNVSENENDVEDDLEEESEGVE